MHDTGTLFCVILGTVALFSSAGTSTGTSTDIGA
jgi:hypothetical protein